MRLVALFLALLATSTAAQAEWWRAETDHFIVYSEDAKDSTEAFAIGLERFDNALRILQGMELRPDQPISAANKVTIYRAGTSEDVAMLAGATGSGIAGFYIARAGGAVAFTPARQDRRRSGSLNDRRADARLGMDPVAVLQHEYVHHFMLQTFPATYPAWYVEGFAELNGTIALNPDGSFHVGNPPLHRVAEVIELFDVPLEELFDQKHELSGLKRYQAYSYGWLLSHYLSFEPKRQGQLAAYLKALGRGEDGLEAARAAFGDLKALAREVRAYKARIKTGLPGFNVKPADYATPAVRTALLPEAEAAIMREHMRSQRGVSRRSEAADVARDLEGPATKHRDNLFVQLAAAEAFLDAKRFAEADAAADRALALDPGSTDALILKGSIAIAQGKAGDPSRFAAARAPLRKAARADGDDPRAFILYYQSFDRAGERPPEDAIAGLESVFDHAASDSDYRTIVARQLLIEGKGPAAKTILAPITYEFHGNQEENKMRAVVDLIDAGKPAEALAKLDADLKEAEEEAEKD